MLAHVRLRSVHTSVMPLGYFAMYFLTIKSDKHMCLLIILYGKREHEPYVHVEHIRTLHDNRLIVIIEDCLIVY